MDLEQRLAKRQARREDLGALVTLILFVGVLLGAAVLPGFLSQHASTIAVPAQQQARR